MIYLWLIPILINIYTDRNGRKPNYLNVFIARGTAAIFHGALMAPNNWIDYFPILIFQVTSYWILFDLGLNLVRRRKFFYYDRKEGDSGWIERFFKDNPTDYAMLKIAAFIFMVLSFLVIN